MGNLCCLKKEAVLLPQTYNPPEEVKQTISQPIHSRYHSLPLHLSIPCPKDTKPQGISGLENLGNTCFMNSALQCIVNTQPLLDYFLIGLFESDVNLNKANPYKSAGLFSNAFACLAVASWRQDGTSLVPRYLLELVLKYAPNFHHGFQHDAHEFLSFVLDILHEELNRADKSLQTPSIGFKKSCENRAARSWRRYLRYNSSIIVDLFQGQLRSTTKCTSCKGENVKFETFWSISLPVPRSGKATLNDCFKEFSKPELMEKQNCWVCPRCKRKVEAIRKCEIWKLPTILIIQLKRFYYDGKRFGKITELVKFPIDNLDLSETAVGTQKDKPEYSLYAQINHKGNLEKGHFYSIVKNWRNNNWYICDDSDVRPKDPEKLVKKHTYMLFYQRTSQTCCFRQQSDLPEMWPHEISLTRIQSTISDEDSVSFISNCSHFSGNSS